LMYWKWNKHSKWGTKRGDMIFHVSVIN
jgi:hypothetical protein